MKLEDLETIEQLKAFLSGTQAVAFSVLADKDERYTWIRRVLVKFRYLNLGKRDKGVVLRYLEKISGYSRQQLTRLLKQYQETGRLTRRQRTVMGFTQKYTSRDIRLLAEMDERHGQMSGPAIKKLCERACTVFGETEYQRLAGISVSHLYNLRRTTAYRRQRVHYEKTKPRQVAIGERRKPTPNGQPGYIRVDTVHQGDWDKQKGVYHINAVDEVTQYQVVVTVEKISERYLVPALEQILDTLPFVIYGFHSDNGSEYVNQHVAQLLSKLLIEFTKSRSRHSNDNALAESKNAAVVRKCFGYSHIPQKYAPQINEFNQQFLNPYINFHRPCFFPETLTDDKGKQRKVYRYDNMMTPYEKFKSLLNPEQYLKPGLNFEILDQQASRLTDNQAADLLNQARQSLFKTIHEPELKTG